LIQNKVAKEEQVKKQERLRSLLGERDRLQSDIDNTKSRLQEKENRRKDVLVNAWRAMLAPKIQTLRTTLEAELATKRESRTRALLALQTADSVKKALEESRCPTCFQDVVDDARKRLEMFLMDCERESNDAAADAQIKDLERRIGMLRQEEAGGGADVLREINETIDDLKVSVATMEDRLREIREQTQNLDESEIRRLYGEYEKAVEEISIVERGIKEQDKVLAEINENISKVESELVKKGGIDLERERRRRQLCDRLHQLFDQGVKVYRDQLREKVEQDATALFVKLTNEPEYAGLSINESYGLTIQHEDGNKIPVRSAGAEHIVALSLMGALQKNAPLQGPIIMDSPFGRLDSMHTTRVVRSLPEMARQVILLVYESELEPRLARSELLGNLKREYRIQRRTARHSVIEKIV
jgi:DNA sulfur modification protein DndD